MIAKGVSAMPKGMLAAVIFFTLSGSGSVAFAQVNDADRAITARVHATFQDSTGGLGVLSADMTVVRFELRNGVATAIGEITGALADSAGNVLGQVDEELAVPISNVMSTCNQLQMDLAAVDAEVLQVPLHFDKQVAGFDSREGTTPRALAVLCTAAELLRGKPTAEALVRGLNAVATGLASKPAR
jgi:hypothetical protein